MPLSFNMILNAKKIVLKDVRLLRHKDNRTKKGMGIYSLWRDDIEKFNLYQSVQDLGSFTKLNVPYWASFVVNPADETMFVGLYKITTPRILDTDLKRPHMDGVDKAGSCYRYDLNLEDNLKEYIGRLIIDWGPAERAWIQRADHQDKPIIELRKEFKEPDFPGFLNFIKSLSELEKLPKGWIEALKNSKGIYLLTCPKTKEQYVGAAYGDQGFWGRWLSYIATGHGGDVVLKSREPSDYQVSILEVAGSSLSDKEIINMEGRWKNKLQSREMGLNKN